MDRFRSLARRGVAGALLAVLVCASVTGCGSGRGEVSGVVRCYGKPLPFGTIQSLGADGVPHAATIQPDGTFSVEMPAGEAKVIVSCVDEARLARFTSRLAGHGRGGAAPAWLPRELLPDPTALCGLGRLQAYGRGQARQDRPRLRPDLQLSAGRSAPFPGARVQTRHVAP